VMQATTAWPIAFAQEPLELDGDVQVSFVIGHRGMARAPQLLATLASIAAQRGVRIECVVVEQSVQSEMRSLLPPWVKYVHTPLPHPDMPYCRSWALNVGARVAVGRVLVFHDNDMLVPVDYSAQIWNRHQEGSEVVNLKRFIFYLTDSHSREIEAGRSLTVAQPPEAVMQNSEAGGSVAMAADAFFAIGGYDESFVGWGGEDNEFWERAQTRRVWPYGYLPMVHLWHPPQPEKLQIRSATREHLRHRSEVPPADRVAELKGRDFGNAGQLDPAWPPAAPGS